MENQENRINMSADYQEIDLRDIVNTLLKHKKIIVAITAAAGMVALAISAALPPVYSVTMIMEIGKIIENGKERVVISPGAIKEKIDSGVYGDYSRLKITAGKDTDSILFYAKSDNVDAAKNDLNKIAVAIAADQQKEVDGFGAKIARDIALNQEKKANIDAQIISREAEITANAGKISLLENSVLGQFDFGAQLMLLDARAQQEIQQREILDLRLQAATLDYQIEDLRAQSEKLISVAVASDPEASSLPLSPKPLLNAVLAALLGLFVAIFGVFIVEWWKGGKV